MVRMIKIKSKKEKPKIDLCLFFRKLTKGFKKLKLKGKIGEGIVGLPSELKLKLEKEKKAIPTEGIEIAGIKAHKKGKKEVADLSKINIIYPLIPRTPKKGEKVFAYANIKWSPKEYALVYNVIEHMLTKNEQKLLDNIKNSLIEKLDVDFSRLRKGEARDYLKKKFEEMIKLMAETFPKDKQQEILYYIERDFIGLGRIEPLMQDPNIEDISCDGTNIPLYIYHRNPQIGSIRTNIIYTTPEELDSFVNKLVQRCGKTVSVAEPLIDATLPDGSRLQATLGTDIARRGSNFTIRRFTEYPLTPIHILNFGTLDSKILAYLWFLTEYGRSSLISGGTATGKTSLLNALSLFIKQELKIVTIEDTAELRLPHPHWVPQVARQPMAEIAGKKLGEVDMFDLLRESLRQRPDFIIVGEVRGREAFVLFQQIATGHPSFATIHADTMEKLIDRLTTAPITLPASLIENLDCIIFIVRVKKENIYVRRISSIYEVIGYDRENNMPIVNEIFKWNPTNDTFDSVKPSLVLKKIANSFGLSESSIKKDVGTKIKVLEWMSEKNITDYRLFAKIIKMYYTQPEKLMDLIG